MQLGETVTIDGEPLSVAYDRLLEDSRCPEDVQCVWAGNARIALTVNKAGSTPGGLELNTALEPRTAAYEGYVVTLVELGPGREPSATISVARG